MPHITVLDQNTINKIAAGEVIERPASVVKELLENAIDAKATAVTVEIRDGGISFIRVTDKRLRHPPEEVSLAFLRHSTSKISSVEDLFTISSLGFRGGSSLQHRRRVPGGGDHQDQPGPYGGALPHRGRPGEILRGGGSPGGNHLHRQEPVLQHPVRRKFFKDAPDGGGPRGGTWWRRLPCPPGGVHPLYPEQPEQAHTSGNHNLKDIIYTVFGREIASNLLSVEAEGGPVRLRGFIGKPIIARSNRNYENYYINGRYIKSGIISKAIEEAYRPFMMQHKYPFTLLHFEIEPEFLDVNVHPTKMELRFRDGEGVYQMVLTALQNALAHRELIPSVSLEDQDKKAALELRRQAEELKKEEHFLEPFERGRMERLHIMPKDAATVRREAEEASQKRRGYPGTRGRCLAGRRGQDGRVPSPAGRRGRELPAKRELPMKQELLPPGESGSSRRPTPQMPAGRGRRGRGSS